MKPISLKMSAFGPYKDIEEVDFKLLNEAKLYLITGDTGSGKTTIFDAITFALYGNASGKFREVSSLRSSDANSTTKTFVEFTFESNGLEYKIVRNPEYLRPSLKGDKLTKEKADVTLYYNDKIITGFKNVNVEVETILGMTRDQFSQITMIAQGDFLKLLFADTKDRINIFRGLFNTSKYNIFQDKIKYLESEARTKYVKERDSIIQYISDIKTTDSNKEKIEELVNNNSITYIEDIIHEIRMQIKTEERILTQLQTVKEEHGNSITKTNTEIGKLEIVSKNIKLVNDAKDFIESNTYIYNDLLSKVTELESKKEEIEKMKVEHSVLVEKFNTQKELEKLVSHLKIEVDKLEDSSKNKSNIRKSILNRNIEIDKEIDELKDIDKIEKLKANKLILSEKLNVVNQFKKELVELAQLGSRLDVEKDNYKITKTEMDNLKSEFDELENTFYASQAAILALHLKENEPCPVCGSTTHPNVATSSSVIITKEEIDQKKKIVENKKEVLESSFNACNSLKISFENIENKLIEQYTSDFENNINKEYNDLYQELSLNEQNISQMEKDIKYVNRIKVEKEKNTSELEELVNTIIKIDNELTANNVLLEEKQKQLSELSYIDETIINNLKVSIDIYNKDYSDKSSKKEKLSREIEISKATINNLEPQIIDKKIANIELLKNELHEKQQEISIIDEKIKSISYANQLNIDIVEKVEALLDVIAITEKKHIMLKSMSDTANGKVSEKDKIMLETYVQMSYFDKVIEYANTRFMVMSEGQFELKRRVESNSKVAQVGLDLDVIDHYNGTNRSVKSLSGGESFMASLSLALGLSDEIQYSSGGLNIESMFVDEGFGTLSEEALNNSIKILSSLTTGNKSIGIISHVSELKQKIDTQVYVSKDRYKGSKIEIRR